MKGLVYAIRCRSLNCPMQGWGVVIQLWAWWGACVLMVAMIGFGFCINTLRDHLTPACLFAFKCRLLLCLFMPRQSCEDVVRIGTYSVIRYAKKEMLAFWNRVSYSEPYWHMFTCGLFVHWLYLIHWPISANTVLLDTFRDRHSLMPFR